MLNQKKLNTKLMDEINNYGFLIKEKTASATATAGGGYQGSFSCDAVSGYRPIAVVGFESNKWEMPFSKCILTPSDGKVYWAVRNTTSSQQSVSLTFKIMYISTNFKFA